MVENQHPTPLGRVVTRGTPICQYERALSGAILPGMLVVFDTNEFTVKKSDGVGHPYGWVGYEASPASCKPDTIDTPYQSGDIASIVAGSNFEIYSYVTGDTTNNVEIYPGTPLADNGDGTLKVWDGGSDVTQDSSSKVVSDVVCPKPPVAIAQEHVLVTSAATPNVKRIHVLSLI